MNNNIRSFYKVAFSNITVMILGVVSTLIIPTVLGPSEFGQWQVYVLYSSYVGLLLFGFCDGLYLIYGGKSYKNLEYRRFSSYFYLLSTYTVIISLIGILLIGLTDLNAERKFTFIAVFLCVFLQGVNSYFVLINQATSRFNIYSVANVLEKLCFVLSVVILLFLTELNFIFVILISLLAKTIVLIINIMADKELVFTKPIISTQILRDLKPIIKSGLPLTLSGVFSMLITGIGRFLVESNLGVTQFGYYSLAFSVNSIVTQVIVAGSVVLYPIMRNRNSDNYYDIVKNSDKLLEYAGVIINILFFPVAIVITIFMPQYIPSLVCILVIFPILIYQSRMSIVYNTFYKVLRMEKRILINGLIALIFCFLVTILLFTIKPTIFVVSIATLLSFVFWNYISGHFLYKKFNKRKPFSGIDLISTIVFIILNLYFSFLISIILYSLYIVTLLFVKRNEIIQLVRFITDRRQDA